MNMCTNLFFICFMIYYRGVLHLALSRYEFQDHFVLLTVDGVAAKNDLATLRMLQTSSSSSEGHSLPDDILSDVETMLEFAKLNVRAFMNLLRLRSITNLYFCVYY